MGWIDPPQNSYDEVLMKLECDLIWRQVPCRSIQDKVKSLGWALIQYNWWAQSYMGIGHKDTDREKTSEKT